jgi:hypothetical protein
VRWYRLTKEDRHAVGGPSGTDAMGALALSLDCWHEGTSIYVAVTQITSFVDESGTGGDDRILLGGLAARSHRWFGFAADWRRLLKVANIPFSHLVDMENGKKQFEGWNHEKAGRFFLSTQPVILKHCDFGQTVAIDLDLHKTQYCALLADKVHKDSAYGLCARAMIEGMTVIAQNRFGPKIRLNFIFEDNEHYGDARRIFDDLKAHVPALAVNLGTITPGQKIEFGGLQAADLIASLGRRFEARTTFKTADMTATERRKFEDRCPIWHVPLSEDHLPGYCKQSEEIAAEKRGTRRKRGFEKWKMKRGY